jgi:hypothetical protein
MTRAQIDQLDAIADGARISVLVANRDSLPVANVRGGAFLQRGIRAPSVAWLVAIDGAHVAVYEGDRVAIREGSITVML